MKAYSIASIVLVFLLISGPFSAKAYTIDDVGNTAYWGGVIYTGGPSTGDVIGTNFDIYGMNVAINGNTMTVTMIGPYFSSYGSPFEDGDLYISSKGWYVSDTTGNAPGSKYPSAYDTFKTDGSENWDYVVGIKNGVSGIYKFDPTKSDFQLTNVTIGVTAAGRANQAWKGGYGDFVNSATITPDYANSRLTYIFDVSFLTDPFNMGFHWTMACGNDVIEGQAHITPEPVTLLLLGGGLIALGVIRWKFRN